MLPTMLVTPLQLEALNMDPAFLNRNVNEGFSGGEKKRNEILQRACLEADCAILDEIDSGACRAAGWLGGRRCPCLGVCWRLLAAAARSWTGWVRLRRGGGARGGMGGRARRFWPSHSRTDACPRAPPAPTPAQAWTLTRCAT